jgi:hypothetical protein
MGVVSRSLLTSCPGQWINSARSRLHPNLNVNGIEYSDFVKQKQGVYLAH